MVLAVSIGGFARPLCMASEICEICYETVLTAQGSRCLGASM